MIINEGKKELWFEYIYYVNFFERKNDNELFIFILIFLKI